MRLSLPSVVTRDFQRKAVALFFALLIWRSVSSNMRDEDLVLQNVPLAVTYDPAVVVLRESARTVDVSLRGSRRRLEQVSSQDVQIGLQVPSDIHEGVYYYGVGLSPKKSVRHAPPGVRITSITPDRVELHIDRLVTKPSVAVRPEYAGSLREGYEVVRATPVPDTVLLRGPHRDLLDIRSVSTEPILLDDTIVQDFTVAARLVPIPGVTMPESVRVDLVIGRRSVPRTLHGVPLAVLVNPAGGLQVEGTLPEIAVTVRGPKAALDEVTELSVCPFLDLSAITSPGRYRRQVNTWLTGVSDVAVESTAPSSVEVTLVPSGEGAEEGPGLPLPAVPGAAPGGAP